MYSSSTPGERSNSSAYKIQVFVFSPNIVTVTSNVVMLMMLIMIMIMT